MNVVLEVAYDDNVLVGFGDEASAEAMIVERFNGVASSETFDCLMRIEHEGSILFSIRSRIIKEKDPYEYVDNEGNAINADGSDFVEHSDTEIIEDEFEINMDYLWIIRPIEKDKAVNIAFSEYYLITTGPNNVFEDGKDFALITTARP